MLGRHSDQNESQKAVSEQLILHEKLTAKIKGLEGSENSDESEDDDVLQTPEAAISQGLKELDALKTKSSSLDKPALFAMKFMKRAADKQESEVNLSILEAENELNGKRSGVEVTKPTEQHSGRYVYSFKASDNNTELALTSEEFKPDSKDICVQSSGPLTLEIAKPLFEIHSFDDLEEKPDSSFVANTNSTIIDKVTKSFRNNTAEQVKTMTKDSTKEKCTAKESDLQSNDAVHAEEENPWMDSSNINSITKKAISKSFNPHERTGKHEKALLKLSAKINEHRENGNESNVDENVELQGLELKTSVEPTAIKPSYPQSDSDDDSDFETAESKIIHEKDIKSFSNSDIMKMAFANDDVMADFQNEKEELIETNAPQGEDTTLPGWVFIFLNCLLRGLGVDLVLPHRKSMLLLSQKLKRSLLIRGKTLT